MILISCDGKLYCLVKGHKHPSFLVQLLAVKAAEVSAPQKIFSRQALALSRHEHRKSDLDPTIEHDKPLPK